MFIVAVLIIICFFSAFIIKPKDEKIMPLSFVGGYIRESTENLDMYNFYTDLDDAKIDLYAEKLNKHYFPDMTPYLEEALGFYKIDANNKVMLSLPVKESYTAIFGFRISYSYTYKRYILQNNGEYKYSEDGTTLILPSGEPFNRQMLDSGEYYISNTGRKGNMLFRAVPPLSASQKFVRFFSKFYLYIALAFLAWGLLAYIRSRRYKKYLFAIGTKDSISFDELITYANVQYDIFIKDIEKMTKADILINPVIDKEKRLLILSKENKSTEITDATTDISAYIKPEPCEFCGATNSIEAYKRGKCEYCGGILHISHHVKDEANTLQ